MTATMIKRNPNPNLPGIGGMVNVLKRGILMSLVECGGNEWWVRNPYLKFKD